MKIYNPFKAHAVRFQDGKYGIRRLSLFGWSFYCGTYWWHTRSYIYQHAHLSKDYAELVWERSFQKDNGKRFD